MKTYYIGIATNWETMRCNMFIVTDKTKIPALIKDLKLVKAKNMKIARNNYLFEQI